MRRVAVAAGAVLFLGGFFFVRPPGLGVFSPRSSGTTPGPSRWWMGRTPLFRRGLRSGSGEPPGTGSAGRPAGGTQRTTSHVPSPRARSPAIRGRSKGRSAAPSQPK